jgi:hypothetical protein
MLLFFNYVIFDQTLHVCCLSVLAIRELFLGLQLLCLGEVLVSLDAHVLVEFGFVASPEHYHVEGQVVLVVAVVLLDAFK